MKTNQFLFLFLFSLLLSFESSAKIDDVKDYLSNQSKNLEEYAKNKSDSLKQLQFKSFDDEVENLKKEGKISEDLEVPLHYAPVVSSYAGLCFDCEKRKGNSIGAISSLKGMCKAVTKSHLCRNVKKKDLLKCDDVKSVYRTGNSILNTAKHCGAGAYESAKEFFTMVWNVLLWSAKNTVYSKERAKTKAFVSSTHDSLELYLLTEFEKTASKISLSSPLKEVKALGLMSVNLSVMMYNYMEEAIAQTYNEYICYNSEAKYKMNCQYLTTFGAFVGGGAVIGGTAKATTNQFGKLLPKKKTTSSKKPAVEVAPIGGFNRYIKKEKEILNKTKKGGFNRYIKKEKEILNKTNTEKGSVASETAITRVEEVSPKTIDGSKTISTQEISDKLKKFEGDNASKPFIDEGYVDSLTEAATEGVKRGKVIVKKPSDKNVGIGYGHTNSLTKAATEGVESGEQVKKRTSLFKFPKLDFSKTKKNLSNVKSKTQSGLANAASKVKGGVSDATSKVKGGVSDATSKVKGGVSDTTSKARKGISDATSKVKESASKVNSKAREGAANATSKVKGGISDATSKVKESASKIKSKAPEGKSKTLSKNDDPLGLNDVSFIHKGASKKPNSKKPNSKKPNSEKPNSEKPNSEKPNSKKSNSKKSNSKKSKDKN